MKNNVIMIFLQCHFERNEADSSTSFALLSSLRMTPDFLMMKRKRFLEVRFQKLLDDAHCALGIKAVCAVPCADERVAG